ncbi:hypothetical protein DBR42_01230 [Pelomonas sp. HMWF004]|nr:hypothetical protein DBR42_01230 [Pelomonas sp. HMWF004]
MSKKLFAVIAGSIADGFSIHSLHTGDIEADAVSVSLVIGGKLAEAVPVKFPAGGPVDLAGESLALFVAFGTFSSGLRVVGPFIDSGAAQVQADCGRQGGEPFEIFGFKLPDNTAGVRH